MLFLPWYYGVKLPEQRDLVLLRPPKYEKKGRNKGFETVDDCRGRNVLNIKALGKGDEDCQLLAELIEACSGRHPCGSAACKLCMREFRRTHTGICLKEARRLRSDGFIPVLLTLIWTDPKLRGPNLPTTVIFDALEQRLRMTLRRAGIDKVPVIGGFEIDWSKTTETWDLHAHLVAFVKDEAQLDPLRRYFKKANGVSRPMHAEKIKRLSHAIPYLWKFSPMRKVRYRLDGKSRTRKLGLDADRMRQALIWLDQKQPDSFVFLQGFKRHGTKIVRLA